MRCWPKMARRSAGAYFRRDQTLQNGGEERGNIMSKEDEQTRTHHQQQERPRGCAHTHYSLSLMSVTRLTSQEEMSWLKALALMNTSQRGGEGGEQG